MDKIPPPETLKFIDGSASTGSYAVLCRRGNVVLGARLLGFRPGDGPVSHKTYFAIRVRSAAAPELFGEEDAGQKVVSLADQNLGLTEAWPELTFENVSALRASTIAGVFIRGTPDQPQEFIAHFDEQKFLSRLVDWVLERAGKQYMVVDPEVLVDWWRSTLQPFFDHCLAAHATKQEVEKIMAEDAEAIGLHSLQMKKIYEKHQAALAAHPQAEDAESGEFGE